MKTAINDRTKYVTAILSLMFICEVMFHTSNKIIQMFGICLLPIILIYGFLLFKYEKK